MTLRTNSLLTMYKEAVCGGMTNTAIGMLKDDKRMLKPYGTWNCTTTPSKKHNVLDWTVDMAINSCYGGVANVDAIVAIIHELTSTYQMRMYAEHMFNIWRGVSYGSLSGSAEIIKKIEPMVGRIQYTTILPSMESQEYITSSEAVSGMTPEVAKFIYDRYNSDDNIKIIIHEIAMQDTDII